jgi:hypothetical protein
MKRTTLRMSFSSIITFASLSTVGCQWMSSLNMGRCHPGGCRWMSSWGWMSSSFEYFLKLYSDDQLECEPNSPWPTLRSDRQM